VNAVAEIAACDGDYVFDVHEFSAASPGATNPAVIGDT
jgi:hypothetical protein